MRQNRKGSFYEVANRRLRAAVRRLREPRKLSSDEREALLAEVFQTLSFVQECSDVTTDQAHRLAKKHDNLPSLLAWLGEADSAEFAVLVLADLKFRKDKTPADVQPAKVVRPSQDLLQ